MITAYSFFVPHRIKWDEWSMWFYEPDRLDELVGYIT